MDDLIRHSGSPGRRPAGGGGNRSDYHVAAAQAVEPDLVRKIVVAWLGGNTHHQPSTMEFNLMQDPDAVIFDSGVLFCPDSLPGRSFAPSDHTQRSRRNHQRPWNAISDFLYERFVSYSSDHFAWAKEIWGDISAIAYLLDEELHADRNSTKPSNTG